jgi:hypothetical protein
MSWSENTWSSTTWERHSQFSFQVCSTNGFQRWQAVFLRSVLHRNFLKMLCYNARWSMSRHWAAILIQLANMTAESGAPELRPFDRSFMCQHLNMDDGPNSRQLWVSDSMFRIIKDDVIHDIMCHGPDHWRCTSCALARPAICVLFCHIFYSSNLSFFGEYAVHCSTVLLQQGWRQNLNDSTKHWVPKQVTIIYCIV